MTLTDWGNVGCLVIAAYLILAGFRHLWARFDRRPACAGCGDRTTAGLVQKIAAHTQDGNVVYSASWTVCEDCTDEVPEVVVRLMDWLDVKAAYIGGPPDVEL